MCAPTCLFCLPLQALNLSPEALSQRSVESIDVVMDPQEKYNASEDLTQFKSKRTGRGPFAEGWQGVCEPVMTAYKLVTVDVPYWGFGTQLERFAGKVGEHVYGMLQWREHFAVL